MPEAIEGCRYGNFDRQSARVLPAETPPALLCRPIARVDTANTCPRHRRRQSKRSVAATKRIEGIAHLTRVTVEGIFDGIHAQLATDIDPVDVKDHTNAVGNAVIDGIDWKSRQADLRKIHALWEKQQIDGMYTLATLDKFRDDLKRAVRPRQLV